METKPSDMTGGLIVVFHRIQEATPGKTPQIYPAIADQDGNFTVPGKDGKGIPPGNYRISVQVIVGYENRDRLGGRYSRDKSKITRLVAPSPPEQEFEIDLAKPEG